MTRFMPYGLDLAGRRWSADWSREGDEIVVRSAYGSARRVVGRRKPDRLAEELLREILAEYADRASRR
jgi:hypothetical protein